MRRASLVIFALVVFMTSCSQSNRIEGTLREVTENTLTITAEDDRLVTFSTRGARIVAPAGIHCGSPVEVSYADDITDGFGNADRVEFSERYNLLIGRWVTPYKECPDMLHGFELLEDGSIIEIGDHSIIYCFWKSFDDTLVLAEVDDLDCEPYEFVQHWKIEHLDKSSLTISYCGVTETYSRVSR